MEVVLDHPNSILLVAELLLLRLLEEEVEVERLLRAQDGREEVPQLLAQLLAPLVPSPQAYSSRRLFGLHFGVAVLVALSALQVVRYLFSVAGGGIAGSAAMGCGGSCEGISGGPSATAEKLLAA